MTRFDRTRRDPDLDRTAAALGVPVIVVGSPSVPTGGPATAWSSLLGVLLGRALDGIPRLVPFGEFIPLRGLASAVTPFANDPASDLVPGDHTGVFDTDTVRVGLAICYEVAYDLVPTGATRAGAQLLVVPTNNAWFGRSEMTYQQLAMARLRVVEHDRAVVVAATGTAVMAVAAAVRAQVRRRPRTGGQPPRAFSASAARSTSAS